MCTQLFPQSRLRLPIFPYAGHSIVFRSPKWNANDTSPAYALFTDSAGHESFSAEIFARASGDLYMAGVNSTDIALPARATDQVLDEASLAKLRVKAERICGAKMAAPRPDASQRASASPDANPRPHQTQDCHLDLVRQGLCFRPATPLGRARASDSVSVGTASTAPLAPDAGIWTAAGHGPWGITLGPGTGKVVSQMMLGKPCSADTRCFRLCEFS